MTIVNVAKKGKINQWVFYKNKKLIEYIGNDKPEKTALYNRKLEASSSEADRLYQGEHAHHWIIDSCGRGTCKYCHDSKQFPEPDYRQIYIDSTKYGGMTRQEYFKGGILA